jgi:hypothetical protein
VTSWEQRRLQRRLDRRLRKFDRTYRRHGLPSPGAREPADWRGRIAIGLTVVVAAGLVLAMPGLVPVPLRQLVGLDRANASGDGSFAFLGHQPLGSSEPVTWDPCRPIRYVVNTDGGPDDAIALVEQAVKRVEEASGFDFAYAGRTDDRPDWDSPVIPSMSSDKPVLIAWAEPDEVGELSGKVAGVGGSVSISTSDGRLRYATGAVTLDSGTYARLEHERDGAGEERAILLHELGHVLGLAHVKDPGELMYEHNIGVRDFGRGDLDGLDRLGHGPCF